MPLLRWSDEEERQDLFEGSEVEVRRVDQQQDRRRRERAAQGGSPQPQGADVPEAREDGFWWCHAHSGDARTAREKLATMPRDADIDLLYEVYSSSPKQGDGRPEWGDRAVWEELHRKDPFPFWLD